MTDRTLACKYSPDASDIMIWIYLDAWIDIKITSLELTVTENIKCVFERIVKNWTSVPSLKGLMAESGYQPHVGFNINYLSNSSVRNKLPALPQFFSSNFVSRLWSWTCCQLVASRRGRGSRGWAVNAQGEHLGPTLEVSSVLSLLAQVCSDPS